MRAMWSRVLGVGLSVALLGAGSGLWAAGARAAVTLPVRILRLRGEVLVVATVKIKGHSYPFIVDTGASKSSVDVHLARLLRLRRVGRPIRVQGVGGTRLEQVYRLRTWTLDGQALPSDNVDGAHLLVAGFGPAGLVGSDILSRYGKVSIDYQHGLLTLGG